MLMVRDATQLTGSVTYFNLRCGDCRRDPRWIRALWDATRVEVFTQELRLASDYDGRFQWVIGGFYSDIERNYGQTLPTPGYDAADCGPALRGLQQAALHGPNMGRRWTARSSRASRTTSSRWRSLRRARSTLPSGSRRRSAARYYDFDEDRVLYFGGVFADSDGTADRADERPGIDERGRLPAARAVVVRRQRKRAVERAGRRRDSASAASTTR